MKNRPFKLALALIAAFHIGKPAFGMNVAGIQMDDNALVERQMLQLNGAGIRHKMIFKVYAAGLYLSEKKLTTSDVLALHGPKRVVLVMLRNITSEELSKGLINGIKQNLDAAQQANIMVSIAKLGGMFGTVPELTKGTVVMIDMLPDTGLNVSLNGKKLGEPITDMNLCNALLKIWLGEKPVDGQLKQAMLGGKSND